LTIVFGLENRLCSNYVQNYSWYGRVVLLQIRNIFAVVVLRVVNIRDHKQEKFVRIIVDHKLYIKFTSRFQLQLQFSALLDLAFA